ncbi:hypothetical protein O0L34_g13184 [Tuta absoluta]|nr:hypothetical protein O0L34_g13184 [Tuta absoluta]
MDTQKFEVVASDDDEMIARGERVWMYGRYQRDLSEAAREEARRLRRLKKKRRRDDKLRQKELEASGKRPRGKVFKVFGLIWAHTLARMGEDWIFLALLGIIMAIINFCMDQAIACCNNGKYLFCYSYTK